MHAFLGNDERNPAPLILGHEATGVVLQGLIEGKRVTLTRWRIVKNAKIFFVVKTIFVHICPSMQTISMQPRQGAFAELVVISRVNLVVVPRQIDLYQAALTEPIDCG